MYLSSGSVPGAWKTAVMSSHVFIASTSASVTSRKTWSRSLLILKACLRCAESKRNASNEMEGWIKLDPKSRSKSQYPLSSPWPLQSELEAPCSQRNKAEEHSRCFRGLCLYYLGLIGYFWNLSSVRRLMLWIPTLDFVMCLRNIAPFHCQERALSLQICISHWGKRDSRSYRILKRTHQILSPPTFPTTTKTEFPLTCLLKPVSFLWSNSHSLSHHHWYR